MGFPAGEQPLCPFWKGDGPFTGEESKQLPFHVPLSVSPGSLWCGLGLQEPGAPGPAHISLRDFLGVGAKVGAFSPFPSSELRKHS